LGENLIFSTGTNRVKTIQAYHASDNPQLVYQIKKGTANPVNVFSALAAEFTVATTLRVAPDISTGSNTFQVNTGGKIIGDLTHVTIHATNLNLTNYANEIRITGLPFKPDPNISGGNHIGNIHAVSFMVNNAHGDDGFVAVATHNATFGSHIAVFSEQVDQVTHYLNASPAKVTISITYIAE
jgi:hypothetical protein